uniref:BBSome interacting protein 1 n=1 Tax=Podarcis muralis TaxID=64176 RepID=A0A670HZ00_PODMU
IQLYSNSIRTRAGKGTVWRDGVFVIIFGFSIFLVLGMLAVEDVTTMVLCKPKLLPLKSVTLEKLEKMQREAQETIRQQELLAQQCSNSESIQ